MRTSLIILSALALLSACANDTETTAPISAGVVATSKTESSAIHAYPPGPSVSAKQSAPVMTTWMSPTETISGITSGTATATCPAGSVVVGGGHHFMYGQWNARIRVSMPTAAEGWEVTVESDGASVSFQAVAKCMQL